MADALVFQFIEILVTMGKEEVTMLLGAEGMLQQLEGDVRAFSGVLHDAERRAFTNTSIRKWLADVKDLVYDADDIIDYSTTHAEKLARLSSSEHPVLCYTSILLFFRKIALRHQTGKSIRSVNERLERIRKSESDLRLIAVASRDDRDRRSSISSRILRQTGPLLDSNIVGSGIENDTSYLVGLLTREEELGGPRRIPIVAITGMGGVGKTTLAQNIYNHNTIKDSFWEPPPMWVRVSQQYSEEKILREIIRRAGGGDPGRDESFAELQIRLAAVIEGKKFFLILDDVWAAKVWVDLLRNPLQSGAAAGSRVLITARQQSVARQMGAIHLHPVYPLSEEESWSLLCKLVGFQEGGGIGDGGEVEIVKNIGRQIAKKCNGLPLAIKTIAGVLRTKSRTRREWEMVLTNPAWSLEELPDGVMGVLYLSYQDLPLQLKQCFIFFSLFPEDTVFLREALTRLWVAEGYITEKGGGDVLLEDVADDFYNELITRSLLQPIDPEDEDDEDEGCKMHDLLRSLAQFLAGDEYFVGDVRQLVHATATSSSMKLRHLSIVDSTFDVATQVVKEHESLRTLLLLGPNYSLEVTEDPTEVLFNKLGRLRVMDFNWTDVKSLPKSLGYLIHLRYLNLSGSSVVELPETFGNLSNLQYLILRNCRNLNKLPRGIAKLYKLRSLVLQGTPVLGLPAGIGRLQHLNSLIGFVTNENRDGGWCSLKELSLLSQLRTLTIASLEGAGALIRDQSRGFLLWDKYHMRNLELCWDPFGASGARVGDEEKRKMELVFEVKLRPPLLLEKFKINGFFGSQFPSWLMTSTDIRILSNLRRLDLVNCEYCKQLPPLGWLPNLNILNIIGAHFVRHIGADFMGFGMRQQPSSSYIAFPKLKILKLINMSSLVEWQWKANHGAVAMPSLENLELSGCFRLRSLPSGLADVNALTTLSIQDTYDLRVIKNFPYLKVLVVSGNSSLEIISNLPSLQNMTVDNCPNLRYVRGLDSLQSLVLEDLKMESLPEWLLLTDGRPPFPMLRSLHIIVGVVRVLLRCLRYGPDWPKIQHYSQVVINYYRGPWFVRYTRDPFTFTINLEDTD